MIKLGSFIKAFVTYYFSQPRQLFEPVILPPWIGNRQVKQLKQSREGMLDATKALVAAGADLNQPSAEKARRSSLPSPTLTTPLLSTSWMRAPM